MKKYKSASNERYLTRTFSNEKSEQFLQAIKFGDTKTAKVLMDEQCISQKTKNKALRKACKYRQLESVKLLLEQGARAGTQHNYAIQRACQNGDLGIVQLLIAYGADPLGSIALTKAATNGHADVVTYLLSLPKQCGVLMVDDNHNALYAATDANHPNIVKILLESNTLEPDCCQGVLENASEKGYLEVVQTLLKSRKIDPSEDNNSAFYAASKNGHTDILKALIECEEDSALDSDNASNFDLFGRGINPGVNHNDPLKAASENGHFDTVKYLLSLPLKYCVNPKENTAFDRVDNAFINACTQGHFDIVKLFLESDDFIFNDRDRAQAIMRVYSQNNTEVFRLLSENSVQKFIQDSPFTYAMFDAQDPNNTGDSISEAKAILLTSLREYDFLPISFDFEQRATLRDFIIDTLRFKQEQTEQLKHTFEDNEQEKSFDLISTILSFSADFPRHQFAPTNIEQETKEEAEQQTIQDAYDSASSCDFNEFNDSWASTPDLPPHREATLQSLLNTHKRKH